MSCRNQEKPLQASPLSASPWPGRGAAVQPLQSERRRAAADPLAGDLLFDEEYCGPVDDRGTGWTKSRNAGAQNRAAAPTRSVATATSAPKWSGICDYRPTPS